MLTQDTAILLSNRWDKLAWEHRVRAKKKPENPDMFQAQARQVHIARANAFEQCANELREASK